MTFDPKWLKQGKQEGALWLVVVCDEFDWSSYPCFEKTEEDMRKLVANPGQMQKVMEVYDLRRTRKKGYQYRVRDDLDDYQLTGAEIARYIPPRKFPFNTHNKKCKISCYGDNWVVCMAHGKSKHDDGITPYCVRGKEEGK